MNAYRAGADSPDIGFTASLGFERKAVTAARLFSILVGLCVVLAAVVVGLGTGTEGTPTTSIPSQVAVLRGAAPGDLYGIS
ncbi:hypothetical protein [Sinomonas humi]|uniref:Uncharacterized protein n=1 Tax=Sinomonas humi TaxID=1338436 RepID=A0A0B2AM34_9MICC|nr:hypothetical protein [Sinomonas humi]KHL02904.1 hypothetical protein LK10_10875 [Sinomonas humi]